VGLHGLDLKYLLVFMTGLPPLLLGLLGLLARQRFTGKKRPMVAFGFGLAVPLSALAGAMWFASSGHGKAMLEMGLPVLAVLTLLAYFLPLLMPRRASLAISLLGIGATLLLLSGLGRQAVPGMDIDLMSRAVLPAPSTAVGAAAGHPDVILISIDTLRADAVLDPAVPTPHLDALRARSLWAPFALAASPSTLPSHITMMVGESPLRHGAYTNLGLLQPGPETLAEAFHEVGYRTAGAAANGLLQKSNGFDRGFEDLVNVAATGADSGSTKRLVMSTRRMTWASAMAGDRTMLALSSWLAGRRMGLPQEWKSMESPSLAPKVETVAAEHLQQLLAADRPYFYFLHFMAPHAPYDAIPPFRGSLSSNLPIPQFLRGVPLGSNEPTYLVGHALLDGDPEAPLGLDLLRARYGEELAMLDAALGRLLAQVAAADRPTVVLFTSDHGEHFGENGKMRHGNTVYAPVLRVPFFLSGPGIPPGELDGIPYQADIPLTLLHAAGFAIDSFQEGRNLLAGPLVEQPYVAVHEDRMAVYDSGYKLILAWESDLGPKSPLEKLALYAFDTSSAGLHEATNLLGTDRLADTEARLWSLAENARDHAIPTARRAFDAKDLADLAVLGYAFDEEGKAIDD